MLTIILTPLTLNPMVWANLLLAILIIGLSTWYAIKGRKLDRWMMVTNIVAGCWVFAAYTIILVDYLIVDYLTPEEVTLYFMRPAIFVLLTTKLANVIRIGRGRNV